MQKKEKQKTELLAPAGSPEAFYGAIHAGADAVYLAGSRFGARAYADNFTVEELIDCIRYAHIWGRRVYLTVNILMKEREIAEICDYLKPFYEAGLDAVIVQDIGAFSYIREHFPDLKLHVSTQMTITGKYGAELLWQMGADRIVPARELSLKEIEQLKEYAPLEVETFIHGAMCYCYSGQCLFSSMLGERSGNRGRCAQPCRLPYRIGRGANSAQECYPLSLKDMCTIQLLPELLQSGIDSFKIEGRMKKPEYAAGVTAIYRKYIDLYYEMAAGQAEDLTWQVDPQDLEHLSRLYMRSEHETGYYHRHSGREMVTLSNPAYSAGDEALIGEIRSRYLEERPRIPVTVCGEFQVGQPASVTYKAGELSATAMGESVQAAKAQPITQENLVKQLGKLGNTVLEAQDFEIYLSEGAFCSLKLLNQLRREAVKNLEDQLIASHGLCVGRSLEGAEVPVGSSEVVADRQRSWMETCAKVIDGQRPLVEIRTKDAAESGAASERRPERPAPGGLHVSVCSREQLQALLTAPCREQISRLYLDGDLFFEDDAPGGILSGQFLPEIVIALPRILRAGDEQYLERLLAIARTSSRIKGFEVSCMEALGFLKHHEYSGRLYGSPAFYIWNTSGFEACQKDFAGFCMPLELDAGEQWELLRNTAWGQASWEKLFYGRIPMMVTVNCLALTQGDCRKKHRGKAELTADPFPRDAVLTDRYQKQFPVRLHCMHCMNTIYNSVPLSLHREWGSWRGHVDMRLDFTTESPAEVLEILGFFGKVRGALSVRDCRPPFGEYTTGHEKRRVE